MAEARASNHANLEKQAGAEPSFEQHSQTLAKGIHLHTSSASLYVSLSLMLLVGSHHFS
jgi:hypothetical protein